MHVDALLGRLHVEGVRLVGRQRRGRPHDHLDGTQVGERLGEDDRLLDEVDVI